MPGQLRIEAPHAVKVGHSFDVAVHITGALPGDTVTIRLWQTAGVGPLFVGEQLANITHLGSGTAVFLAVTLAGPCTARLVADDSVSVQPLTSDDAHVEVTS